MANKLENRPNLVIYLINTVNSQGFIRKSFREKLIKNKKQTRKCSPNNFWQLPLSLPSATRSILRLLMGDSKITRVPAWTPTTTTTQCLRAARHQHRPPLPTDHWRRHWQQPLYLGPRSIIELRKLNRPHRAMISSSWRWKQGLVPTKSHLPAIIHFPSLTKITILKTPVLFANTSCSLFV